MSTSYVLGTALSDFHTASQFIFKTSCEVGALLVPNLQVRSQPRKGEKTPGSECIRALNHLFLGLLPVGLSSLHLVSSPPAG